MLSTFFFFVRTQDMGGDPFGMLLRQRIVFLGGEVRTVNLYSWQTILSLQLLCYASDTHPGSGERLQRRRHHQSTASAGLYRPHQGWKWQAVCFVASAQNSAVC